MSAQQQAQPTVLRVVVLDDTYGCVQHIKDLQKADLGSDADASVPSAPRQLLVRSLGRSYSLQLHVSYHCQVLARCGMTVQKLSCDAAHIASCPECCIVKRSWERVLDGNGIWLI